MSYIHAYIHPWWWWWWFSIILMMGVKQSCTYNVCLLHPLYWRSGRGLAFNGHRAFQLLVTMGHSDMPLQKDPQWSRGIYRDSYCSLGVAFIFVKDGNNGCIFPILGGLFLIPTLTNQLKWTGQNWNPPILKISAGMLLALEVLLLLMCWPAFIISSKVGGDSLTGELPSPSVGTQGNQCGLISVSKDTPSLARIFSEKWKWKAHTVCEYSHTFV